MPFQAGDVAVVKTTGEKCIVLSSLTLPNDPAPSITVRRPVATKDNGLIHTNNVFFEFELETFEQQLNREFSEAKRVDELRSALQADLNQGAGTQAKLKPLVN